jgi:hypothetical protein
VLCNGLSIKVKQPDGEVLGMLSAFLDDTYFVELGRGSEPAKLAELARSYRFEGVVPKIFETSAKGDVHFALVLGPMGKSAAERARWAVLQRKGQAKIAIGADHMGEPMSIR